MANQGQVDFLKQDVAAWNVWKARNPEAEIDLAGAIFSFADLRSANLRKADLSHANLQGADLSKAGLRDANLSGADLRKANLLDADLHGAKVTDAQFALSLGLSETKIDALKAQGAIFDALTADKGIGEEDSPTNTPDSSLKLKINTPTADASSPSETLTEKLKTSHDSMGRVVEKPIIEKPIIEKQAPIKQRLSSKEHYEPPLPSE